MKKRVKKSLRYKPLKEGETPLQYTNRTRVLACHLCRINVYRVRNNRKFNAAKMDAEDFRGLGRINDPKNNDQIICPMCWEPLMVVIW